jgi:hypothetical protein
VDIATVNETQAFLKPLVCHPWQGFNLTMMKCYQKIITPIVNVTDEFGNVTSQYIDMAKVEITNTVVVIDGFIGQWNYTAGNLYSL